MNQRLDKEWIGDIHNILLKAKQREMLPNVRNSKLINRFYNCVAALMTQQLEDMCVRSINAFVNFICDYEVSPLSSLSLSLSLSILSLLSFFIILLY